MSKFKSFLQKKDIIISKERYLQTALSSMALGLFATLLIGTILKTLGEQTELLLGVNTISTFLVESGTLAASLMGAGIGIAIAHGLKAPPLVLFSSVVIGMAGATYGGPAGSFIAVLIGVEIGKAVSKETKLDIIVTPAVTILAGFLTADLIGPGISWLMTSLGDLIMTATEWQPFIFGIVIATIVGLALTAPISSAALCIMLDLSGLAAGAATVGCCAQMVGFAIISYKENGIGGIAAQGLGTSMLQISNIVKNPWILLPPTLAGAIIGPLATCVFKMTNIAIGAGMGTSGLVGQIGTFTSMGFSVSVLGEILLLHILLPAIISIIIYKILYKAGKIKDGDMKLEL